MRVGLSLLALGAVAAGSAFTVGDAEAKGLSLYRSPPPRALGPSSVFFTWAPPQSTDARLDFATELQRIADTFGARGVAPGASAHPASVTATSLLGEVLAAQTPRACAPTSPHSHASVGVGALPGPPVAGDCAP